MYYQGSTVVFLLNVMMMNDCMSIMKDLSFYYIECNGDEWLYECYERPTVVLYWGLITTNGGVSITGDLLLCCIKH